MIRELGGGPEFADMPDFLSDWLAADQISLAALAVARSQAAAGPCSRPAYRRTGAGQMDNYAGEMRRDISTPRPRAADHQAHPASDAAGPGSIVLWPVRDQVRPSRIRAASGRPSIAVCALSRYSVVVHKWQA